MSQETLHVVGTDVIDGADAPATQEAQPTQAEENPGMDLLRAAGFPFNPSHLPNVRLDGENVVLTITTPESLSSQEFKDAIAALQARGCTVDIDGENQLSFVKIEIRAPQHLLAPATIDALTTKADAERIRGEQRDATRRAQDFDALKNGVGC